MEDSSFRSGARPESVPKDSTMDASLGMLQRFGDVELVCCCRLALRARELSSDRRCRVEISGGRPDASGMGNGPDRVPPGESDPGWHRLPVRGPGTPEAPEAWLAVELRGDELAPPGLERLSSLVAVAGLVLERHRMAREVRRARGEAEEARAVLGHALRGHLHAALLRADNLLLASREDRSPDLGEIQEQLRVLKGTVEEMVEEIRQVVEEPEVRSGAFLRPSPGDREQVDVPELLREAGGSERAGEIPFRVEVQGEVPDVRADPPQLASAFRELFELARQSPGAPPLSVRPHAASSGVRLDLTVELAPFTGRNDGPEDPGADGGAPPGGGTPGGPAGDASEEDDLPSLREVVAELGGRLWIEAGPGTRATVEVVLPADGGE